MKIIIILLGLLLIACSQPDSESLNTSEIRSTNTVVSWGGIVEVKTNLESTRNRDVVSDVELSGGDYLEVETAMGISLLRGSISQLGIIYAYGKTIDLPENILDVSINFVRPGLGVRSESSVTLPESFNINTFDVNEFSVSENIVLTWSPANPGSDIVIDISPGMFFFGTPFDGRNSLYRKTISDTGMYEIPLSSIFADVDVSSPVFQQNSIRLIRENRGTLSGDFNGGSIIGYQVRGKSIKVFE